MYFSAPVLASWDIYIAHGYWWLISCPYYEEMANVSLAFTSFTSWFRVCVLDTQTTKLVMLQLRITGYNFCLWNDVEENQRGYGKSWDVNGFEPINNMHIIP
jgi:hypothetical protein